MSSRGDDGLGRDAIDRLAGPGERAPVDRRIETEGVEGATENRVGTQRSAHAPLGGNLALATLRRSAIRRAACPLHARFVMSAFTSPVIAEVPWRMSIFVMVAARVSATHARGRADFAEQRHHQGLTGHRGIDFGIPIRAAQRHRRIHRTVHLVHDRGDREAKRLDALRHLRHVADARVRRTAHGAERRRAAIDAALHPAFEA